MTNPQLLRGFLDLVIRDVGLRPLPRFTDWSNLLTPLAAGAVLAGCGGEATEGNCSGPDCGEICDDGVDNERDGAIDCADSECASLEGCTPATGGAGGTGGTMTGGVGGVATGGVATGGYGVGGTAYGIPYEMDCGDTFDNDYDGSVDCADSDCLSSTFCSAPSYGVPMIEDCTVAGDEDLDGLADCADPDCVPLCGSADYAVPFELCGSTGDEDADGLADCADPDCFSDIICTGAGGRYAIPY